MFPKTAGATHTVTPALTKKTIHMTSIPDPCYKCCRTALGVCFTQYQCDHHKNIAKQQKQVDDWQDTITKAERKKP